MSNRAILIKKPKLSPEQEKEMRDKLHKELPPKLKLCSNPSYECSLQRIPEYDYCMKHILLDPKAPYKQCSYIYSSNGKRCPEASPKYEGKDFSYSNFCFEHTRLTQLKETKSVIGKFKPFESSETLINSLSHLVKFDKNKPPSGQKTVVHDDYEEEIDVVTPAADPFVDLNATEINNSGRTILDYASDSSSEDENTTLGNTWRGYEMDNSDNESIDSQDEDYLKHAGVYTTDELTMITKEKLTKLKNLYMDQFLRLQHVLKEKRKLYLQNIKKEKETFSNIHDQPRDSPRERKLYEKLKALNHYHKRNGVEAILRKRYIEKRSVGAEQSSKSAPKCHFIEGGVKCLEKSLPCCKFCRKHVLEDKKQVLFKACGIEKSGIECQEPIVNIFEDSTCVLHISVPQTRTYSKRKYESETEEETEIKAEIKEEIKEEPASDDASFKDTSQEEVVLPLIQENNITIVHEPMEIVKPDNRQSLQLDRSPKNEIEVV